MSDFKIESNIPIQVVPGPIKRRGRPPGSKNKPRAKKCSNADHVWERLSDTKEKCIKCGDIFPCDEDCDHVDCKEAKGLPLPDFYLERNAPTT